MRKIFEQKTIGQACEQLKAECHTLLLQQAKHTKTKQLEKLAQNWARAT